jgi:hypothetical protein
MKMALAMLAVFATLVTLIATVLVLAAFGLGKALSLVLPFVTVVHLSRTDPRRMKRA